METEITPQSLQDLVTNIGTWALFAYLYFMERREHNRTRESWNNDLRDIAGMNPRLSQNQNSPISQDK